MAPTLHTIGLDIGGTSLKSALVTRDGAVTHRAQFPLDISNPLWPETVRGHLLQLEKMAPQPVSGVGVAAPGIAAPDGSTIWWMQGRLAELQGLNWADFLNRPRVPVLNDAQAALIGEAWLGAAAGRTNVLLLTLGTGVGGAAMVDGRVLRGHLGRAGHLGHISLNPDGPPDIVNTPGSLEDAVGNATICERINGRFDSTLALAEGYAKADPDAVEAWGRVIRALAAGIASLINVLDPEVVLFGGGISTAGEALFGPLRSQLDRMEWRPHGRSVRIAPTALGEYAGAIGAARNAMSEM
jgi:glucokinase